MAECFDTDMSVDIAESALHIQGIEIEPIDVVDSAISETAMAVPELSELQQETAELEIEPLNEGVETFGESDNLEFEHDAFHYGETRETTDVSAGADNISKNILGTAMAGVFGVTAAVAPVVEHHANAHEFVQNHETSAIVQEVSAPQTFDDIKEQFESEGWVIADGTTEIQEDASSNLQAIGELAGQVREASEAWLDGEKLREGREETEELINALREPEQGEYRNVEEEES